MSVRFLSTTRRRPGVDVRGRAMAMLGAAALGLTACSAGVPQQPPLEPVPLSADWQHCGPGVDCRGVSVPVDHDRPDGEKVTLGVARHRATDPARRIGVLLVNPGGPGVPATDPVRGIGSSAGEGPYGPEVLARYDIVAMDPRGVGSSTPVRCFTDAERERSLAIDLDPTVPGGMAIVDVTSEARVLAEGCARNVPATLLGRVSTEDVARDMDLVRTILGEDTISYLGTSYGTFLGATYATLFPQRVQHMVLDAPVDPELWQKDPLEATTQQAEGSEQVMDMWFATCRSEGAACPFGSGDPELAFDALVAELERNPLIVPANGGVPESRVDGHMVLLAARTAVFDRRFWPLLAAALVAAEDGDGATIHALSNALSREPDGSPSGLGEANVAVNCLDRDVPADVTEHRRNADAIVERVSRFGEISSYALLSCAYWPDRNPDRYIAPLNGAGAPPILVIGGRSDSQTPYRWSQALSKSLDSAVLLTRDGPGHGSYRASGPCIDNAVEQYLTSGRTPVPATVCPQEPPATTSVGD